MYADETVTSPAKKTKTLSLLRSGLPFIRYFFGKEKDVQTS